MREAELLAINERVTALFNPAGSREDEPGDCDEPLLETMREWQDDELVSLQAQRAEIEAKREAEFFAILDMGPIDPTALAFMSTAQRRRAQAGIDMLIDYLDAVTPDADLEPEGEVDLADWEPNLGAPEHAMSLRPQWWQSVDPTCSQAHWAKGTRDDREVECEDEGACIQSQPHDEEPNEPSLGAPEVDMRCRGGWGVIDRMCSQVCWTEGGCDDRELGDDNGLADMNGLCEQVQAYGSSRLWSNGGYVA